MLELKMCIDKDDEAKFKEVLHKEIYDGDEVLMYIYAAVTVFHSEQVFYTLLRRNNFFEVNPEWNLLLC